MYGKHRFVLNVKQMMVLLISAVCWIFFVWQFLIAVRIFLLWWEFFYYCENFSIAAIIFLLSGFVLVNINSFFFIILAVWIFLLPLAFFAFCENFVTAARIVCLVWGYFSCCENFSFAVRMFLMPAVRIFFLLW